VNTGLSLLLSIRTAATCAFGHLVATQELFMMAVRLLLILVLAGATQADHTYTQ
jgi:hypothetical protein